MKKQVTEKIISALLVVVMLLSAAPIGGLTDLDLFTTTANAATTVESGCCGYNVNYTLDSSGNLVISGNGEIFDYFPINYSNYSQTDSPFCGNNKIKTVTIQNGIKRIGQYVFSGCPNLSKITIAQSVESIGPLAFYNTAYYNNKNNWKNHVLYIDTYLTDIEMNKDGEGVLSGSYTIKDETRIIADWAFAYCKNLTSITIPKTVFKIGSNTFAYCTNLSKVTISNGLTAIEEYAFGDCFKLNEIIIPNTVSSIGAYAFLNCKNLTEITIPNSVTFIDDYALGYNFNNDYDNIYLSNLKIMCNRNSVAEKYAKNNGIEFEIIEETVVSSMGDVNNDHAINSADALLVLQFSVGSITLTDKQKSVADVNKDKKINSSDALRILQYSVDSITKL